MEQIIIRQMKEEDIETLVAIEKECFSMPWSEQAFKDSYVLPYTYFFVAESNGKAIGYAGLYKLSDDGDITNVAVSSIYRRKGIAYMILKELLDFAYEQKMSSITLEVRESNNAAIALYEKLGFKKVGVRKNFYEKPQENAIIYQYIF